MNSIAEEECVRILSILYSNHSISQKTLTSILSLTICIIITLCIITPNEVKVNIFCTILMTSPSCYFLLLNVVTITYYVVVYSEKWRDMPWMSCLLREYHQTLSSD